MKSRNERRRFLELIWCCCLLLLEVVNAAERAAGDDSFWTCGPSISTPGITLPRGDVSLLHGQSLEILCLLNTQHMMANGLNSSHLAFYRNKELVESEFLTVVNSTALRLLVPRPSPSDSMYYCRLGTPHSANVVCYNKVVVGERPTLDNNFRCVSQNWDNLTCTWKPHHNYLVTTYNLTYRLPGRSGRSVVFNCNNMTVDTDSGIYTCFWDLFTTPHYRQSTPHFHFTLNASNKLSDVVSRDFHINHFARMKPARPMDLKVENKTEHSALLSWSIPYSLLNFPPGLMHRVIYTNDVDGDGVWSTSDVSSLSLHNATYLFNVTGLVYAYCHYTVRVSIRSEKAYEEEMWSDYTPVTFSTAEKIPDRPPDTDVGGFESVANLTHRSILFYWRQILSHEENGDNFRYKVGVYMRGMKLDILPFKWTKGYIQFKGLPLTPLEFFISSANNVGESSLQSRLVVPEQNQTLPEPMSFTKTALGNGTYELTWRHPVVNMSIVSDYTIFWCDNYRDRPYQCEGRLQWERVPASLTARNYTVTEDKIYQFAISANGYGTSSGMVWASCTIIPNTAINKIKDIWTTNPQSTSITVNWKLECPDNVGVIKGYRIFYCRIDGLIDTECKEPMENITVVRRAPDLQANVTGLRPYTTYAIQIAIIASHEEGPQSDSLNANTLEGAPDVPRNVRVSDLSNTRMLVSWEPPERTNGVIKDYRVSYRNPYDDWVYVHVDEGQENPKATFRERLITNLTSYSNYTVRVEACTVVCSNWSEPLLVRSAIGPPGAVRQPTVQSSESYHRVHWEPPERAGGTLDLYEVKVLKVGKDFNDTIIYNTTDMELVIEEKMCLLEGANAYQYSVRAINYDAAEDHGAAAFSQHDRVQVNRRPPGDTNVAVYRGPWSPVAENTCTPAYSSTGFYWVLMVVGMVFVVAFLFMGCKWLYRKIDTMSSIKPVMPDGLIQSDLDKDAFPWVLHPKRGKESEKHSQYPPASADEVSLLGRPTPAPASPGTRDMSGFSATTTSTSLSGGSSRRAPSPNSGAVWDAPYFGSRDDSDSATPTNVDSGGSLRHAPSETCNPYSTIRCLDDSEGTPTNTENPYVTAAPEFPKLSNGYVQACPLPAPQVLGPPVNVLPANYVRTAPDMCPVMSSPYVAVDDPRIRAALPASAPLTTLHPKACISMEPSGGGYVKHDDAMFSEPCTVVEPGRPLAAKRISAPPLVLGKQLLGEDKRTSLGSEPPYSPEYCRFGWKPEEPPSLVLQDYPMSPEDYKESLEDYTQELEQEAAPGCTPLTPASHYLPLNVPTLQS